MVTRIRREMAAPKRTRAQVWTRASTIGLICILLPIIVAELILRVSGFYRPQLPLSVQVRTQAEAVTALNRRFETDALLADRYLLWKLRQGANLAGLNVRPEGWLESPARENRATSVVLCLGDSMSAVSYATFPHIAQRLADEALMGSGFRFINAAVAGYSTEQGLRWLDRLRAIVHPAVIVIAFGWNDGFPALNLPDKELGSRNGFAAFAHEWFSRWRLYQFLAAPRERRKPSPAETTAQARVPLPEFESNLRDLVEMARSAGAVPILATQPENLAPGAALKPNARTTSVPLAILHRRYNRSVRNVASDMRCYLLDLEEEFDRRNRDYLLEPDGMHLSGPGHNLAARLLIGVLRNEKQLTPQQFDSIVSLARYDSAAPDKPDAAWDAQPQHVDVTTSQNVAISVRAKNNGNTKFLQRNSIYRFGTRRNVDYGGVSIAGYWRNENSSTASLAALSRLSHDLLPGETTSLSLTLAPPAKPGDYALEIGLRADYIGDLKRFGAKVTTVTVTAKQP